MKRSSAPIPVSTTEQRAVASLGTSSDAIYRMVARTIKERHPGGQTLLDVGCGTGRLWPFVRDRFEVYIGADVIRHANFLDGGIFRPVDLDSGQIDMPNGTADVIVSVETIEHVENPRALVRELTRLVRPGGLIIITTPNQLSLMSKLGLLVKNQFPAFQERPGLYPAHLTALLPVDLLRMAKENGLVEPMLQYSDSGRIPGTSWHWPPLFGGRNFETSR